MIKLAAALGTIRFSPLLLLPFLLLLLLCLLLLAIHGAEKQQAAEELSKLLITLRKAEIPS